MDNGVERITDPAELRQVRAQARMVYLKSVALAAALTAALALMPI